VAAKLNSSARGPESLSEPVQAAVVSSMARETLAKPCEEREAAAEAMQKPKILVSTFCYNENVKIERTLNRFPAERDYEVVVIDDGSTDDSVERIKKFRDVLIVSHPRNLGAGAAIRTLHRYALENNYDVVVLVAGNDKDDPLLIPRLLQPILEEGYSFVQGSRYMKGGGYGKIPFYRVVATKFIHPLLFSLAARRWVTESTNGFRAYRTALLRDPRIDLDQDWLDKYELEPYLYLKAIRLGYRVKEVPVTKVYPPKIEGYTKMKPITGWWSILRPIVYLGLGLKK
jgi:dolichol-phosphate mannosyltransferase